MNIGVHITHNEFDGLAEWGFTAPSLEKAGDGHGRGTPAASIVAGIKVGAIKQAYIIAT